MVSQIQTVQTAMTFKEKDRQKHRWLQKEMAATIREKGRISDGEKITHEIQPAVYQPSVFFSSHAFEGNQKAFLCSSLATDKIPAIVQGKCRVQRMSKLFAKHWALTLALQQFVFFILDLSLFLLIR